MRRHRRSLQAGERAAAAAAVVEALPGLALYAEAPIVLAYVDTDAELPTGALLASAAAAGKRVYLPRLVDGRMIFAEHRLGSALRLGAFGIPEPTGEPLQRGRMADALALLPLLAWDDAGGRVGRGGGHYDAVFSSPHRPCGLVGLAYAFQQHPRVPRDPWDLRLDCVVTEHGVHTCWAGDAASPFTEEVKHDDGSLDDRGQPGAGRRRGPADRALARAAG
jgi:5-formyltetrahydrofolate cyclo-ligase